MSDDDVLIGCLMEDAWLTLDQVAAACMVEPDWLMRHVDEGLFPHAVSVAGVGNLGGLAPDAEPPERPAGSTRGCTPMLLSILPSHKIDPKRLIAPRFQLDDFRDVRESIGNAGGAERSRLGPAQMWQEVAVLVNADSAQLV
ncbi:MerR family transcriptional regulator [Cupriavidus necator]|uniref:MerR family transcriptional regulator n=1 Tax=Cupriavidus necator TaxID=106590 RepID=A0A1U9UMP9_CUPNE|nr:MerR family transcriptional regulator [Cupriavidus necator]